MTLYPLLSFMHHERSWNHRFKVLTLHNTVWNLPRAETTVSADWHWDLDLFHFRSFSFLTFFTLPLYVPPTDSSLSRLSPFILSCWHLETDSRASSQSWSILRTCIGFIFEACRALWFDISGLYLMSCLHLHFMCLNPVLHSDDKQI